MVYYYHSIFISHQYEFYTIVCCGAIKYSSTMDNVETQPYIIKDGETIDNVAKKLNLSFSQLAKLNQFRIFSRGFENVKPGDEIDVPVNTGTREMRLIHFL